MALKECIPGKDKKEKAIQEQWEKIKTIRKQLAAMVSHRKGVIWQILQGKLGIRVDLIFGDDSVFAIYSPREDGKPGDFGVLRGKGGTPFDYEDCLAAEFEKDCKFNIVWTLRDF